MSMHIDAKVQTIRELKDFYFVVPDYQREYVWEGLHTMLSQQPDVAMLCVDHAYSGRCEEQLVHFTLHEQGLHPVPVPRLGRKTAQEQLQMLQTRLPAHSGKTASRPVVSARNIAYSYRGASPLWSQIDICLPAGKILAVVGGNGSGKSTLLAVLSGLLKPSEGKVTLPGRRLLIPQNPEHLFLYDRVWRELGTSPETAQPVLHHLGLARSRQYSPYRLSHGQKRRLNLGLAQVYEPDLLLLDEPTQGQDPAFRTRILKDISGHARRGAAVIVATHDWDLVQEIADEVLLCV